METQPPLPSDIWDHTPPEAQAYIEALIARVTALEAAVKESTEQLQQDSTNSSRPRLALRRNLRVTSPQARNASDVGSPVAVAPVVSLAIRGKLAS